MIAEGTDSSGKIIAVPTAAYAQALHYNRDLFTKAGLDPDKPPTTWDEIRTDAKVIQDKLGSKGVHGFFEYGAGNQGGWHLTSALYGAGNNVVSDDGSKAAFNGPEFGKSVSIAPERGGPCSAKSLLRSHGSARNCSQELKCPL